MKNTDVLKIIKRKFAERDDIGSFATDRTDHDLLHLIFSNARGDDIGLRLTDTGRFLVNRCFQSWTIEHNKGFAIKPSHLLFFDRECTMPWYLDRRCLVLFEKQLAMRAKLVGNIDHLITAFQP